MEVLAVAAQAALMDGFADAWGSHISVADLLLRIWSSWNARSRLALILREQPELQPEELTSEILEKLAAPASVLLAEAQSTPPEEPSEIRMTVDDIEADLRCFESTEALDAALAAVGIDKREEGAEAWDKLASALRDTTSVLQAVEAIGRSKQRIGDDAAALAAEIRKAEPEVKKEATGRK